MFIHSFIPEMYSLLSTFFSNLIILGDFNIHVNTPSCHLVSEFLQLLDCFSLTQHVHIPTHIKGNILDLVITDSRVSYTMCV